MPVSAPQPKTTSDAKQKARAPRNWLQTLALVLVWQVVALVFVEGVLFCAGLGEEEIFKLDPVLGVKHMTNKRITHRTEGFAQSWLNEDGMREPGLTVQKPANTYRIATMGDSMVEGMQVPIEQTFGALLEKQLQVPTGKHVQVLNFGTSGYSTAQEYLQLKNQVLKYQPDLVVLCYNSRDIFENWSPADQVITNVRPFALHLPGQPLNVDSSPVVRWMGTPRARFLLQTSWLRQNSRIFGLLSTLELDWSQHNPWYRAMLEVYQHPKKAMNELKAALAAKQAGPAFQIKFFEDKSANSQPVKAAAPSAPSAATSTAAPSGSTQPAVATNSSTTTGTTGSTKLAAYDHSFNSAAGNDALSKNEMVAAESDPTTSNPAPVDHSFNSAAGNDSLSKNEMVAAESAKGTSMSAAEKTKEGMNTYRGLITRTLGSLFDEMRANCKDRGAQFVVVSLPVRAQLCPATGMETSFAGIDYPQELKIVSDVCKQKGISYCNSEAAAEQLQYHDREALFYSVHLRPEGHQFMAKQLQPFLQSQLR